MEQDPQADWKTFKVILLVCPAAFLIIALATGSWTTALPLTLFAMLLAALIVLRGDRGRALTLHIAIATLVIYQVMLLRATVDEPNIGVVWFLTVPALVALLGHRTHILIWTPVTVAVIAYCWRLYMDYPVMSHPLSLPNLIGAALVVSVAAFGVITQRAQRERALQNALDEARAEALEREQAQAEARRAQATITTFLGSMSHELRTPLTSIALSADALDNSLDHPEQRVWTRNIRDSADSLVLLLNDVLELARGDAGAAAVKREPFDVEELIESVRSILQPVAIAKNICLFVGALPDVPCHGLADAARVRQVLVNLLNNALQHSGGSRVYLQVRREEERLKFMVGDNGQGIDPVDQQRVFQPFERLGDDDPDSRQGRESSGTGLGLAIARDYVKAMGGDLTLVSSVGEGALFHFTLDAVCADSETLAACHPRQPGWPDAAYVQAECEHAVAWGRTWLDTWAVNYDERAERIGLIDDITSRIGSVRALANRLSAHGQVERPGEPPPRDWLQAPVSRRCAVCDNDIRILRIIVETLTLSGHRVVGFQRGDDLVAHLSAQPVDAVILDVNLGDVLGVDVLRDIRALPGDAGATPVCMLSGTWTHRESCLAAGASEYLLKPSGAEELNATIEQLVQNRERALTGA